jgi:hypothetical protein
MKRVNLQRLTVDELVQHFASLALEQDDALLDSNNISKVNRLFRKLQDVSRIKGAGWRSKASVT